MSSVSGTSRKLKVRVIILTAVMLALLITTIVIIVPGYRQGVRRFARSSLDLLHATLDHQRLTSYSHGEFTNIIFLHHSTGMNLVEQGLMRERFSDLGYSFWDHGYNFEGLHDPSGTETGYSYSVPDDNTDPDGMARIFTQNIYPLPMNTFSALMQYEVILFKSCFAPTSNIESDNLLEAYKSYYLEVRDVIDHHPEKVFVLLTQPPLNPAETNPEEAARARALAVWLGSEDYVGERDNFFVFDLFNLLAEGDPNAPDFNMLRSEYRNGGDSHPNRWANEEIGPLLVEFVRKIIESYKAAYSG